MEALQQSTLVREAAMQTKMILNLKRWFGILIALSGIGMVLFWWGSSLTVYQLAVQIGGGLLAAASLFAALIVQKGIESGNKNVEQILRLAEKSNI